jgi:MFS family permease
MLTVLRNSWTLLLGITLLMLGNGIQGTLLGVRGAIEGFTTTEMSFVIGAYFAGFLLGSQTVPAMIRRVGHVRVFAALGSLASAGLVLYPALLDPLAWVGLRLLLGFCFCGVYIVAESWLNNTTSNDMRGRALSLYLIAQMVGIVAAQALFTLGDASEYTLFVVVSVAVSLAFTPILLSATPVPAFERTKPMGFMQLYRTSPLGFVGIFLLGAVFSALFGMAGVFGAAEGLTPAQIATFVSAIYLGGMVLQYPIGWLSDRVDRRRLVVAGAVIGTGACVLGFVDLGGVPSLYAAAFLIGGMANPLYGILLAYTNDYLDKDDMAGASARLLFVNGLGAIGGPLVTGWLIGAIGPRGFWVFAGAMMALLAAYAVWRMARRPAVDQGESPAYVPTVPAAMTPVTMTTVVDEWEDQLATDVEAAA